MKLSNFSWRYHRILEYLKPTSYTPSVPFLFLFIANKISPASILSTTRHYSHYRFQGTRPQPSHSFIGSPLAWETADNEPQPWPLLISKITHASPDLGCWAVLLLGAFYDANDRILWQTEVFLGDKAEDSEEPYGDSYSTKHLLTSLKRTITDTRTITLTAKQEAKILTLNTSVSVPEF
ncbi:hypothetical protein NEUTE2DRAFT_169010 [Neurospora tetrasperma FGSC 2509]|nr:hypothetical protein NEUTE2DRAFT_169010 [Neurospora tetrasperma FGSC 2509]